MIEIRNVHLPLSGGKAVGVAYDPDRLREVAARKLGCRVADIESVGLVRRSVDARKRGDVHFVATVRALLNEGACPSEQKLVADLGGADVSAARELPFALPVLEHQRGDLRPVIVGAGAAGLFCAVALAEAGLAPILLERGAPAAERSDDVARFNATGKLNGDSNIQFGAGGAGTFSDGKLTTGTNVAANAWILRAFVEAGASEDILWQGNPHVGSDVLPTVVGNLVERIERAGGEVRWHTRMTELVVEHRAIAGVRAMARDPKTGAETDLELRCSQVVLASGHSARDVFAMLRDQGLSLEAKAFSMGVRIEHPQAMVDKAQYGGAAGHPALPPSSYKLSCHLRDGRGVYTFCMCPGGTVVAAASEQGGVVTNGMSVFARDGKNANSALLASVHPSDMPGSSDDPLRGIELQRRCERLAFVLGGGGFKAPAQLLGDFMAGRPSTGRKAIGPTYPRGVTWGNVARALPGTVVDALRAGVPVLAKRLFGFDRPDAVLTGVETRSSSPVRVPRDAQTCQSVDFDGLYPCGEGAGYAGGIMSAAADGLRCAQALVDAVNARG